MENALALAIKPMQVDVATPLLTASRIRAAQMQEQQSQMEMQKEAAGQFARGVAVYADKPEFAQKWAEGLDDLHARGLMPPQIYQGLRNNPSPLVLQRILAETTDSRTKLAQDTLAETRRHHDATISLEREKLDKPVAVPAGSSLVNPKTGETVHKGDMGMSPTAIEIGARQLLEGDLSALTNLGRGAQGDQKLTALRNRAAEILINERGLDATAAARHLGERLQGFKASTIGQTTEARTTASREANLNLILKATEAAIPAALEQSENVARTGWVPINKIIQKGQVIASDANLRKFGMANLQLAEHWARAMNPTGVMRESDRDLALNFLSTADSKDTYRQVVEQLRLQITRERDAIKGGHAGSSAAPGVAPAASTGAGKPSGKTQSGISWSLD